MLVPAWKPVPLQWVQRSLNIVPALQTSAAISSSRIRKHLAIGEVQEVNDMLGYPYQIPGPIVEGKRIGRTLGFPTLNIEWCPEGLARFGVYKATLMGDADHAAQSGVANYGLRPTISGDANPLLELHLLDPDYIPETGSVVRVALTEFLRPEQAFPSVELLRKQIALDIKQATSPSGSL